MAHELSDSNCTPWWYQTPSLASQSTYQSYYLSSGSQADQLIITPSQSSGYESPADATYTPSSWGNTLTSTSQDLLSSSTARLGSCLSSESDVRHGTQQGKQRKISQADLANEAAMNPALCESGGSVVSLTVNVHLTPTVQTHSSSSSGEMQELATNQSSQYTIECSPGIVIAPVIKSRERSPSNAFVTEQSSLMKTKVDSAHNCNRTHRERQLHKASTESNGCSPPPGRSAAHSQLTHSMSSAEQEIIDYLSPQLMQYMSTLELLPHLCQQSLLSQEDVDYISNPGRTENERRRRVMKVCPYRGPDAFDRFMECLSSDRNNSGHSYLARRLHEAKERKREAPFKRLATLRNSDKPRRLSDRADYNNEGLQRSASHSHKRSSSVTSPLVATSNTPESKHESGSLKQSKSHRPARKLVSPPPNSSYSNERLEEYENYKYSNSRDETHDQGHSSNLKRRHSDKWRNRITPPPVTSPQYMTETTHFLNDSSYQYYGDGANYSSLPRSIGRKAKKKNAERSLSPPLHTSTGQLNHIHNEDSDDCRNVMSEENLFTPPITNEVHPEIRHSGKHQRYHSEPNHLISQPHIMPRRKNSSPNQVLPPSIIEDPLESASPLNAKKHRTHKKDKHIKSKSSSTPTVDTKPQKELSHENKDIISKNEQRAEATTHQHKPVESPATDQAPSGGGLPNKSSEPPASRKLEQEDDPRSAFKVSSEKLMKRKLNWLQEKIHFANFSEEIEFDSLTHYNQKREMLYCGALNSEHGRHRFVVLFTDMLLVMKSRRLSQAMLFSPGSHLDWFADQDCTAKMPLMLHLLTVRTQTKKQSAESFGLHYNNNLEMMEITLQACSKHAKEIWIEQLTDAIKACVAANADTTLPLGHAVSDNTYGTSYTKLTLTVMQAHSLEVPSSHKATCPCYCAIHLGDSHCRTHSVRGKKVTSPMWDFKSDFSDFDHSDTLSIEVFAERITRPDELLGKVDIALSSVVSKQTRAQLVQKHLPLSTGRGTITLLIEIGWETKM